MLSRLPETIVEALRSGDEIALMTAINGLTPDQRQSVVSALASMGITLGGEPESD